MVATLHWSPTHARAWLLRLAAALVEDDAPSEVVVDITDIATDPESCATERDMRDALACVLEWDADEQDDAVGEVYHQALEAALVERRCRERAEAARAAREGGN